MSVFERHVFVCTGGEWCPAVDGDGVGVHRRLKEAVKGAGIGDRVRVNHAGCMNQCGHGPMVVVYPEDVWYAAVTTADVDELVRRHLVGGEPVDRLRHRPPHPGSNKLERDPDGRPVGRRGQWPAEPPAEPR